MARRLPQPPSLRRRGAIHEAKLLIVVCCEGKNTEPEYLKEFAFAWGNRLVFLKTVPGVGVPLTVVQRAVQEKQELERIAARSRDSFTKKFQVWAVYDVDDHPNLAQARQLATARGIQCCVSNPCFELWPLLHFKDQDGEIDAKAIQRALEKLMPSYKYKGSKVLDYKQLHIRFDVARRRATSIWQRRAKERNAGGNPSTCVFRLLDTIMENGKSS
jgi:hypothetical protein